jgi:hypothetical protein
MDEAALISPQYRDQNPTGPDRQLARGRRYSNILENSASHATIPIAVMTGSCSSSRLVFLSIRPSFSCLFSISELNHVRFWEERKIMQNLKEKTAQEKNTVEGKRGQKRRRKIREEKSEIKKYI